MIKSDKGAITVKGTFDEVLVELVMAISAIAKKVDTDDEADLILWAFTKGVANTYVAKYLHGESSNEEKLREALA